MASKDYITYIPADRFSAFDQGIGIKLRVYYSWLLEVGDTLKWFTERYKGVAEVTDCKLDGYRSIYTIKMVSRFLLVDSSTDCDRGDLYEKTN